MIVALALFGILLALALLHFWWATGNGSSWLLRGPPDRLSQTGVGGVALVFGLCAIGDFRYVGFLKRVRDRTNQKLSGEGVKNFTLEQ